MTWDRRDAGPPIVEQALGIATRAAVDVLLLSVRERVVTRREADRCRRRDSRSVMTMLPLVGTSKKGGKEGLQECVPEGNDVATGWLSQRDGRHRRPGVSGGYENDEVWLR